MAEIQSELEREFCPAGLDSSLVAAISHEPGQTLTGAREILQMLLDATLCTPAIEQEAESESEKEAPSTMDDASADSLTEELERLMEEMSAGTSVSAATEEEGSTSSSSVKETREDDPEEIYFLLHAFPGHSRLELCDALAINDGNIECTIMSLMNIEPSEVEEPSSPQRAKAADWDGLAKPTTKTGKRQLRKQEADAMAAAEVSRTTPITDNAWLLSSSVQSQLAILLDQDQAYVARAFTKSFNLSTSATLLVESAAEQYTLADLDEAGGVALGTAATMADGIALVSGKTPAEARLAFRATKGRQDAALDLLDLLGVIRASSAPDVPLGRSKPTSLLIPAPLAPSTAERAMLSARSANGYGRAETIQAYKSGAPGTVLPASSAQVVRPEEDEPLPRLGNGVFHGTASTRDTRTALTSRTAGECRSIAADYRAKRDEALRKASSAYRTGAGGNSKAVRAGGGAAWVYANLAREAEQKSRMWAMRAAHQLIGERRGVVGRANEVDLHGLSLQEGLHVLRAALEGWWGTGPASAHAKGHLKVITGVGRHSRDNVAVLRPAVKKMLEREGWDAQEDEVGGGVFTVKGRSAR